MKALSIRQPWAWFIVNGYKDVENRSWWPSKKIIGKKFYVHAGQKRLTAEGYREFLDMVKALKIRKYPKSIEDFDYGAVVGTAVLQRAVDNSKSDWAGVDCIHFILKNAKKTKPKLYKGQLGFFEISQ